MMNPSESRLDCIDLNIDSCGVVAALIKLLAPHVPYSLSVLGTILNASPRTNTLQNVDLSQVSLWSTTPLHSDAISTTDLPPLFSVVVFSHFDCRFRFFCSGESYTCDSLPMEVEETHVKEVFEQLREIARGAHSIYNSALICYDSTPPRTRIDTDLPMIVVGGVHAKWARVLRSMSTSQNPHIRYVFPPGARVVLASEGVSQVVSRTESKQTIGTTGDGSWLVGMEISQIRAADLPFVYGASSIPRSDSYVLSRAPYSVCLRSLEEAVPGQDANRLPVACALMHSDGSIGGLHIDPKFQRQGLGTLVIHALRETLDFSRDLDGPSLTSDIHRDLGGGALGWNWTDTSVHNEAGNRFFMSLVGKENSWMCHWIYIPVNSNL